jgi:hypothetical protein
LKLIYTSLIHLRQFIAWLEQYYSARFETALKDAREFAGNSKYDIPLPFKEKRTIHKKKKFHYGNGDEPIGNPENRFRMEYFYIMI